MHVRGGGAHCVWRLYGVGWGVRAVCVPCAVLLCVYLLRSKIIFVQVLDRFAEFFEIARCSQTCLCVLCVHACECVCECVHVRACESVCVCMCVQ